jgi:hypothetical protein
MINKYYVGDVFQLTIPDESQLGATLRNPQLFKIESINKEKDYYLLRNMQTGQLSQPGVSSNDLNIFYRKYGHTKYPY